MIFLMSLYLNALWGEKKKFWSEFRWISVFHLSIQAQLDSEAEAMRVSHRELLSVEDTVYMPDKDTEPVNRTLIQKAGYLNIRK